MMKQSLVPLGRAAVAAEHRMLVPVKNTGSFARFACVLLVCVFLGRLQELWSPLHVLRLGILSLGIGLIASLNAGFAPLARQLGSPQGKKIAGIFVFCLLSVPLSVWPSRSLMFTLLEFGLVIGFLSILLTCIRTTDGILLMLKALAASAFLLAVASLVLGQARVAASGTYDPNDIALVMVISLPIMKLLFTTSKNTLMRLAVLFAGLVMLATIAHTGSRGGIVGLGAVILFILFADKSISATKKFVVVSAACLAIVAVAPDMLWERMSSMPVIGEQKDYNLDARAGRIEIWKRALRMMADNPLTGVGAGAFPAADGLYLGAEGGHWSVAHNSFLEIGATIGVIGLALFVSLLWTALASMMRLARSKEFPPGDLRPALAMTLAASLVGYISCGFFLSQGFTSIVYFLLGMTMILTALAEDDGILAARPKAARQTFKRPARTTGPDEAAAPRHATRRHGNEPKFTRRR